VNICVFATFPQHRRELRGKLYSHRRRRRLAERAPPPSRPIVQNPPNVKLRPKPIPAFDNRFAAALGHFGAALLETSGIVYTGIKGTKREDAFREFLAQRLPKRYGVASGEVVDQLNVVGPQLDALVFDQTRDFSFSDGDVHVLPAEALLVSIEVKSKLDAAIVRDSWFFSQKIHAPGFSLFAGMKIFVAS
jgi:hypothetical protein